MHEYAVLINGTIVLFCVMVILVFFLIVNAVFKNTKKENNDSTEHVSTVEFPAGIQQQLDAMENTKPSVDPTSFRQSP